MSDRFIINTAIMIVLISFLFMISGCLYYKVSTEDSYNSENVLGDIVNQIYPEKLYSRELYTEGRLLRKLFREYSIYAIDSNGRWLLENLSLSKSMNDSSFDTIFFKSTFAPLPPDSVKSDENRKSMRYKPEREDYFTKRINLYVETLNYNDSGMTNIPVSTITRYDIYSDDHGKHIAVPILITAGIVAGSLLLLIGIGLAIYGPIGGI